MAASNQLIVEVIGDTRKLEAAMKRSEQATTRLGNRMAAVGAGFVIGQVLRNATRDMADLGGEAGRLGKSFNSLLSLDVVGFFRSARSEIAPTAEQLVKTGDAAGLLKVETEAAAAGFDKLAAAAKSAAAQLRAAETAAHAAAAEANVAASIMVAGGNEAAAFGERTDRFGRGAGAIAASNALEAASGGTFRGEFIRRRGITAGQRNTWFDALIGRRLDLNQDIKTLGGQVSDLKAIEQLIRQRIAVTKDITRQLNLEAQLRAVTRERQGVEEAIVANREQARRDRLLRQQEAAETRLRQRTERQFRMLGLSPTGEPVTPGVANLKKRVESIADRIAGTKLDTPRLEAQLRRFRKVLSDGLVPKDVRSKIDDMLNDINEALKRSGGMLTTTTTINSERILAGLGLGRDTERILRARLSHFNSAGAALAGAGAGGATIDNNITIVMDGRTIEPIVTSHQQARRRRNPSQRRGPNQGLPVA